MAPRPGRAARRPLSTPRPGRALRAPPLPSWPSTAVQTRVPALPPAGRPHAHHLWGHLSHAPGPQQVRGTTFQLQLLPTPLCSSLCLGAQRPGGTAARTPDISPLQAPQTQPPSTILGSKKLEGDPGLA